MNLSCYRYTANINGKIYQNCYDFTQHTGTAFKIQYGILSEPLEVYGLVSVTVCFNSVNSSSIAGMPI